MMRPLLFSYMATSQESNASQDFIKNQKEIHGRSLAIEKVISIIQVGVSDIFAIYAGMPVYAESKWINKITQINKEPFKPIQIEFMRRKSLAGAMCIGLLLNDNEPRYILWNEIPSNGHITKEQFLSAEILNWQMLREIWKEKLNEY